ncbi:MAG: hypothetical protein M3Z85_09410 [Acidobacteriota bacterium]|nr:hypothetical protein [Acidobacteriota bacterium]
MSQDTQFNRTQLATWQQARDLAQKLSAGPIVVGNGVKPENKNQQLSGIYIPDWQGGPANFQQPHFTDKETGEDFFFLHFRFRNGAEGMNVGLILDTMKRFATSPVYAMNCLADEARHMAR